MARVESIKNEIEQSKAELAYVAAEKRDGVFSQRSFWRRIRFLTRFCSMRTGASRSHTGCITGLGWMH